MKAFVYRLYPTPSQERQMETVRSVCKDFYNALLHERKIACEHGFSVSKNEQLRRVKELKVLLPAAKGIHSHILQLVASDLDKGFAAFFRRVKSGEKPGYPRFKNEQRMAGFGFKELGNGFSIDGRRLKLSGIGRIAVRWHRPLQGKTKTVRIVKRADGWYACFCCETEPNPLPQTNQEVGVDVGILSLLTTSDGEHTQNPRWYRKAQKRLRILQRSVARKRKGGSNRKKAIARLARHSLRVQNCRKDFLNKVANKLIRRYDYIALEDLRITNMAKNHCLAKSILDAGWGYLVQRLQAKAEEAARVVVLVNPAYTSQTCSCCGARFENLTLRDRWVNCTCGLSMDRDENAARNILSWSRLGYSRWALTQDNGLSVAQEAVPL